MLNNKKLFFIVLAFLLFVKAYAADDDQNPSIKEGSIADTTAPEVLRQQEELKPEVGFDDVFMVTNGTNVINIADIPTEEVEMVITRDGYIRGARKIGPGKWEVAAGTKTGTTQLLYYAKKSDGARGKLQKVIRLTVTTKDLLDLMQQAQSLVGNVEGLDIRVVGDKVVFDGKILVPKDMRRVLTVYNQFKTEKQPVVNLTEISPLTLKLLAEKMEEEIAGGKNKPRNIFVKSRNGRYFLEGAVDKLIDREIAIKTCQAFIQEQYDLDPGKIQTPSFAGLGECVNMVRIRAGQPLEPDPILNVRVDFVTLTRNYFKSFDFRWSPGVNLNGETTYSSDTGKFLTNFVAILTDLFPKLETAANHGHARILKSATLLVRDGEDATSGGDAPPESELRETLEIPFLVPASANQPASFQMQRVETFVILRAKSVPGTDKINLDITSQQSELQASPSSGSAAPVLSNFVRTSVVVGNGESAALGGLIAERRKISVVRDPAGNSTATTTDGQTVTSNFNLFDLGRSHSFDDNKSQFIVFVTPTRVRSASEGSQSLKRKFRLRR